MDIKTAYETLIEKGLSPEEAIQQLKAEFEQMLSEGQIQQDVYESALAEIESLGGGEPEDELGGGEPDDELPEDEFAVRAEQLLENGEFDDFDEAYDFALDETDESGGGSEEIVQNAVAQFINGEIDENQLLELLKQIKGESGAPNDETPLE